MRRGITLAFVALVAMVTVACGGGADSAEGSGDADQPQKLKIGLVQFLPTFSIFVAEQQGFFEAEGLDVELVYIQDQNLVGTSVESGDVQIGSRNYDGILTAVATGFEWKALYPHVLYSSESPDAQLMIRTDLMEGDPEAAARSLEGQPFAVNVGGQSWMSTQVYLENQFGVDPETIEYVDVPYSDMLAAFDQGTIAGAHVVEPFVTAIEDAGVAESLGPHLDSVALLPPEGNGTERFVIQASFARTDWVEANADIVDRFVRAMDAATQAILDDPEQFNELAVEYTGLEEDVVLGGLYPDKYTVATSVTREEAEAPIRFGKSTGLIEGDLELEDVLAQQFPLSD